MWVHGQTVSIKYIQDKVLIVALKETEKLSGEGLFVFYSERFYVLKM